MSLRILHVIHTLNPQTGGPIEGIKQQAKAHKVFGHTVDVASLDTEKISLLFANDFKVHPCGKTWVDNIIPISLYSWLKSNHNSFDAVIVNGIWGAHLYITWLALANTTTPYFVFTHGMLDPWFKKKYPLKHLKKWMVWPWAVFPALRDAEGVLFTCEQEKILARESFWLYDCNEGVVKYGTEGIPNPDDDYSKSFLKIHTKLQGKQVFLFLGRVHPKKGADLLVRAISDLQEEGLWDSLKMRLVFAGPNDNKYALKIINLTKKLGVFESVYWTGMVTGEEKWGAFQSAEAFVLPSHQENFGIAVVEALSCGIPVMITTKVNIADEIKHDNAGLVGLNNQNGVSELFKRWFAMNDSEKDSMKNAARKCFETRFHSSLTSTTIQKFIYLAKLMRPK